MSQELDGGGFTGGMNTGLNGKIVLYIRAFPRWNQQSRPEHGVRKGKEEFVLIHPVLLALQLALKPSGNS